MGPAWPRGASALSSGGAATQPADKDDREVR